VTPRRALIVACVLLAVGVPLNLARDWRQGGDDEVRLARPLVEAMPPVVGGWTGVDAELTPQEREVLQADDVLKRLYRHDDGAAISLFVSFYARRRRGMDTLYHNATVCYPAAGFELVATRMEPIVLTEMAKKVEVARYTFQRGATRLAVLSFFRVGNEFLEQTPRNQPFLMLREKLAVAFADAPAGFVQVQVVADVADGDDFGAARLQQRFLEDAGRALFSAIDVPGSSH
jgi:EpsI family protein